MKKTVWWVILLFGVALVAAIAYFAIPKLEPPPVPRQPEPAPAAAAPGEPPPAASAIRYPVPQQPPPEKPLPALDTSDATMKNAITRLWSDEAVEERFHLKDFIRRVVVTIDNLPRPKLPLRYMPVKPVEGRFLVSGKDDDLSIAPDNAARYAPYVKLLEAIDTPKLVALYVRFYPLFQQAYVDLGYPNGYFNDRLVEVIDDLLAAPDVQAPVKLVRPKVFYLYADPDLESRSAGQKILMRMGHDNAMRVKSKLAAIRGALISQSSLKPAGQ